MSVQVWLLGMRVSAHAETIAARVRRLTGPKVPAILKRLVKKIRIKSNTIELFIKPSETPKENCSAVSVCSSVNSVALISLAT